MIGSIELTLIMHTKVRFFEFYNHPRQGRERACGQQEPYLHISGGKTSGRIPFRQLNYIRVQTVLPHRIVVI